MVKRKCNDPDPEQQIAAPGEGREISESFGDIDDDLTDESTMPGEHQLMAENRLEMKTKMLKIMQMRLTMRVKLQMI